MATGDGTSGYFASTIEKTDICNEILKKLVDLNLQSILIDEQLEKMVQECSERDDGVRFLKRGIEEMKKDQESMKQKLRQMLIWFFPSERSDIGNLEGFLLEQKVYTLMSTKSDNELDILKRNIERCFTRFVDERKLKVNYFKRELDQIPKKSNFATSNIGQSGDETQTPQPQGFKNSSMSLSDVVVEMYGFSRDVALDIQECVASRKLVSEAFKNDSMSDDLHRKGNGFDTEDYLDHQVMSQKSEQEDEETLNWKSVTIAKEKFQDLLYMDEDEQNVYRVLENDMQIDSGSGYCDENILKVMKDWVFRMDSVFCDLVYNFYTMMSGYEPAVIKFRKFNSALEKEKERFGSVVPITVYKILAMPKITYEGVESDKAVLYKEIDFDLVINRFQRVIFLLGHVLRKTLGLLNAQTIDKRLFTLFQTMLDQSEEYLKEIGMKIDGAAKGKVSEGKNDM